MFQKNASICNLVYTGASFDTIIQEIQLCQLLCASCHQLITFIESHIGFTSAKTKLNKLLAQHIDDDEHDDKNTLNPDDLQSLYSRIMPSVYDIAKKITRADIPTSH